MPKTTVELHPVTLKFVGLDAEKEQDYRLFYVVDSLRSSRLTILLGAVFYLLFCFLDVSLMPNESSLLIGIRVYFVFPSLILLWAFTFFPVKYNFLQILLIIASSVAAMGILLMIILGPPIANNQYYAGLMLVIILQFSFLKLRALFATLVGLSVILIYNLGSIYYVHQDSLILLNNNFFLVSAFLLSVIVCYGIERKHRGDFVFGMILTEKKEQIEKMNIELETLLETKSSQALQISRLLRESTLEANIVRTNLEFLGVTLQKLITLVEPSEIYRYILVCLKELMPNCIIFVSSYNHSQETLQVEELYSKRDIQSQAETFLGSSLIGYQTCISTAVFENLLSGKLFQFEERFASLIDREIPPGVLEKLQEISQIHDVWSIGISLRNNILGVATIATQRQNHTPDRFRIESFIHLAAITLQRATVQNQLKQSDKEYLELVESLGEGVCILDENYTILYANPRAEKILEIENQNLLGTNGLTFFNESAQDQIFHFMNSIVTETPFSANVQIKTAQKHSLDILTTVTPHFSTQGTITSLLVIFRDITQANIAAKSLQRNLQYEQIISNIAKRFINISDAESATATTLQEVGTFLEVSRSFIVLRDGDRIETQQDWTSEDITTDQDNSHPSSKPAIPWVIELLKQRKNVMVSSPDELPPEAEELRKSMKEQGVKSVFFAPIMIENQFSGIIGIDDLRQHHAWSPMDTSTLTVLASILGSAWERKRQFHQISEALQDKGVLLREVMHRTLNNLQLTSSIINIQANSEDNPYTKNALLKNYNRIQAMAVVQQRIYQNSNFKDLDIGVVLNRIVSKILGTYQLAPHKLNCEYRISHTSLDVNIAISLGLIVNEVISMLIAAYREHADSLNLLLCFDKKDSQYTLSIQSKTALNRALFADKRAPQSRKMILLLSSQLQGEISLLADEYSVFTLTFEHRILKTMLHTEAY